jgi:molybdopterin-guanine dinucleotide biosynthesis protein
VRAHHDVVDVVQLHGEDDVVASRMPTDQDVLAPRRVFWQETGPAHTVLGAMLALPDDHTTSMLLVPVRASA